MPRDTNTPGQPPKSGVLRNKPLTLEVNKTQDIVKPRPCPTCKGLGYSVENTMIGDTMMKYEKRCWRCQGAGTVNAADDDD